MAIDTTTPSQRRHRLIGTHLTIIIVAVGLGLQRRLRARTGKPSAALVVAFLALVMSVAGNAAAGLIVTSNNQVAANTISGHHAPSGDHPNIIPGSINDSDIQVNGLTGAAIRESTLTGNAIGLVYDEKKCCPALSETFPGLAGFSVRVRCYSPDNYYVWVALDVSSATGGSVEAMLEKTVDDTFDADPDGYYTGYTSASWSLAPGVRHSGVATQQAPTGHLARVSGALMLRHATSVVQVDFTAVSDNKGASKGCSLTGTETLGTFVAGVYN